MLPYQGRKERRRCFWAPQTGATLCDGEGGTPARAAKEGKVRFVRQGKSDSAGGQVRPLQEGRHDPRCEAAWESATP